MRIKQKLGAILMSLMVAMSLVVAVPSTTSLAAVTIGPIDPISVWPAAPAGVVTGFPAWAADATGIKLALMPITGNNKVAPTQNFIAPDPLNPYSVFLGFDSTASYFAAKATLATPNGRLTYSATLDASFVGAGKGAAIVATAGQETMTQTVSLKMPLVVGQAGNYTIQDPYGKNTVVVTAAEIAAGKGLNFKVTVPAAPAPRVFTGAIAPPITAFLKPTAAPPPGWLGDGVTVSTVTGSPTGFNQVSVVGPAGSFLTNQFTVAGRLFTQVAPVASFTNAPATGSAPLTVNFTDTSTGPGSLWSWNFGDGSPVSTVQNPSHIFLAAGTFTVTETVTNAVGTATVTHPITVAPGVPAIPVAAFLTSVTTGPAPLTINFTDTTTGVPTTWSWDFGDGSVKATVQNPSHTFLTAGSFTVTELVTNALGPSSISKIVTVTPPVPAIPVASFIATPTTGAAPLTVNFTDATSGVPTSWLWNFGDGSATSTLQNPSHLFTAVGTFAVVETATNALGTATVSLPVTVTGVAAAALPAAPTGLAATATTSTQVTLTWTDNADNESLFMVQRAPDATFATAVVEMHPPANAVPAPSKVTFSDITAVASTAYFYRVLAGNTLGNSAPSNVVTVTTPAPGAPVPAAPPPPAPPAPPAPAGGGGGGAPPPPVIGGGGGGAAPPPAAPVFTAVSLSGLVSSTGLNEDASGKVQSDAQVKTAKDEVIMDMAAGTVMSDSDGKPITTLSAVANATPPAPIDGGKVLSAFTMGPSGAHFDPPMALKMRFDPAALPSGIAADKLYIGYWDGQKWVGLPSTVDKAASTISTQVIHFTEFGIIAPAASAAATPAPIAKPPDEINKPVAPSDLLGSVTANGEIHLSWSQDTGTNQTGFMIERAADRGFTSAVVEFHVPALTATFTDITAAPGQTYFYRVESVNGVGHSDPSNMVSLTAPAPSQKPAPPGSSAPAPAQNQSSSAVWFIIGGGVLALVIIGAVLVAMRKRKA